jgi:hypothetical protein
VKSRQNCYKFYDNSAERKISNKKLHLQFTVYKTDKERVCFRRIGSGSV